MKRVPLIVVLLLLVGHAGGQAQHPFSTGSAYDPSVPAPASVIGHEVGARFTPHHSLMRYLERLAETSPRIRLDTVARTAEGREVMMAIVTSEANHRDLDRIRRSAARIADPRGASAAELAEAEARTPAILWMGYTVHGPEASGTEAAIAVLYQLAAGTDAETRMILDSTVVLIDPLQNPDGHERHVQDVLRMRTALGVPVHPGARIHAGTWPGPRTSHYYFDLNRDWYAQSHPETRGRVAAMREWWPHVAVDLHEMSWNSTYFFPPTMDPVNALVDPGILDWWGTFADAMIGAFDRNGWSYFRREGYDEFYPGYGSSWPIYSGAVGMTYEQASTKGGAIRRTDGTVLTLAEAVEHHYVASWATALTVARNARKRVHEYADFRRRAVAGEGATPFRAIVFERDAGGRADSLAAKLEANGIEVRRLSDAVETTATGYGEDRPRRVRLPAGAFLVDFAQPQGMLARVLLEPDAPLDSTFIGEELERRRVGWSNRFYDLTAWSLPFAYRLRTWGLTAPVAATRAGPAPAPPVPTADARYGYAFAPGSESSIRLLSELLLDSVRVWHAPRPFRAGGESFPGGAFVVRVAANDAEVHGVVRRLAAAAGARVTALSSAAVDEGTDLGSNSVAPLRPPRVALLSGEPVYGSSFGYAWYAFDHRLGYPTTAIDVAAVRDGILADFDLLVVPSASPGGLARALGTDGTARIAGWVRGGGTLLTTEDATAWLASEALGLARLRERGAGDGVDTTAAAELPAEVPGAIVRAVADTLSPLMAGVDAAEIPVLVFSDRVYRAPRDLGPGELVVRYAEEPRLRLSGYLWPEVPARLAGTPYLWTEEVGEGRVIGFAGDPVSRDLWRGLLPIFANAVLLGPSY